jgi:hypothetical protein
MASLLQSRAAAKEDKGAGRAKKAAAKLTSEAAELPILQLLKSDGVLPWGAAPGSLKLTLPPLKRYIAKHKLQRLLPKLSAKEICTTKSDGFFAGAVCSGNLACVKSLDLQTCAFCSQATF